MIVEKRRAKSEQKDLEDAMKWNKKKKGKMEEAKKEMGCCKSLRMTDAWKSGISTNKYGHFFLVVVYCVVLRFVNW